MINLDQKFESYLDGKKSFRIDGIEEPLTGYGFHCDGNDIVGYWVNTTNYKLYYNLMEQFIKMEPLREIK
ncbi:MAG: hypothetical protein CMJ94_07080 [Planctomycetes bacterium]|nr:hypothetical protein [Planctomycetota bacterium]|tara:strand:- start:381 stop:590 length:210 start_codon:yes stop_codon:yes gene_type:complete